MMIEARKNALTVLTLPYATYRATKQDPNSDVLPIHEADCSRGRVYVQIRPD